MATRAKIEHVVVLMLENRSFDHMLGAMPGVEGVLDADGNVKADLVNYTNPTNVQPPAYAPEAGAQFFTPKDERSGSHNQYGGPSHSFTSATEQLFGVETVGSGDDETTPYYGGAPATTPASNSGFVKSFAPQLDGNVDAIDEVMKYFTAEALPAIHTLAKEFCVCDHWHSEVPGPTEPNRLFMHAATSTGLTYNPWNADQLNTKTIYGLIEEKGKTWGMYGFDLYDSANFNSLVDQPTAQLSWDQFLEDASGGNLYFYNFICPRYSISKEGEANSQHAPYDVRYGDQLIADVYEAVRNGKGWEKTLLIVTYDEHGGYYDHVPPVAVPAPDDAVSPNAFMEAEAAKDSSDDYLTDPDYNFDFKTSGFRVPAILISPWIGKNVVDSTVYGHTSVLKYLEELIGAEPLTQRDAAATSFAAQLSLKEPRRDCPKTVPSAKTPAFDPELEMKEQPTVRQDEVARRYTVKLKGHRDTGKRVTRPFDTNAELNDYVKERNRCHHWAKSDDWKKARFETYADKRGKYRWHLRDSDGGITATSSDAYDSREDAEIALQRVRFLSNVLDGPVAEKAVAE